MFAEWEAELIFMVCSWGGDELCCCFSLIQFTTCFKYFKWTGFPLNRDWDLVIGDIPDESLCFSAELPDSQTLGISLCTTFQLYILEFLRYYFCTLLRLSEWVNSQVNTISNCYVFWRIQFLILLRVIISQKEFSFVLGLFYVLISLINEYIVSKTSTLLEKRQDVQQRFARILTQHLLNFIS